jgi:uncharacterized lipoprotein YddW (UPF0748 family)
MVQEVCYFFQEVSLARERNPLESAIQNDHWTEIEVAWAFLIFRKNYLLFIARYPLKWAYNNNPTPWKVIEQEVFDINKCLLSLRALWYNPKYWEGIKNLILKCFCEIIHTYNFELCWNHSSQAPLWSNWGLLNNGKPCGK